MDEAAHRLIWELLIGYTCIGVFVCTSIISVLSLINVIPLEETYKKNLFLSTIAEIAAISIAAFSGLISVDPVPAQTRLSAADRANATLQAIESSADSTASDLAKQITPRIYIHIASASQMPLAQKAQAQLVSAGYLAPGIENVGPSSPSTSQLRYFRLAEKDTAAQVGAALSKVGISPALTYVPGYEDSQKIRPLHFELWFKKT